MTEDDGETNLRITAASTGEEEVVNIESEYGATRALVECPTMITDFVNELDILASRVNEVSTFNEIISVSTHLQTLSKQADQSIVSTLDLSSEFETILRHCQRAAQSLAVCEKPGSHLSGGTAMGVVF